MGDADPLRCAIAGAVIRRGDDADSAMVSPPPSRAPSAPGGSTSVQMWGARGEPGVRAGQLASSPSARLVGLASSPSARLGGLASSPSARLVGLASSPSAGVATAVELVTLEVVPVTVGAHLDDVARELLVRL